VTTNIFLPSSLKKSLQKAVSLAKVQQPNEEFISLPEPKSIPEIETFSKKMNFLTPNQKVKVIKTLLRRVKEKRGKGFGAFSEGEVELAVVNSLGWKPTKNFLTCFSI